MPSKKPGTLTGSSLERKTAKGSLTGSKRLTNPITENIPATAIPSSSDVQQADFNARARVAARFAPAATNQNLVGSDLAIGSLDISSLLGNNIFAADSPIPEQSASESNSHLLKIQRQQNSISVALAKAKLQQNVVALGIEHQKLQGLTIDHRSEENNVATKGIQFERSHVRFENESSKLLQDRELLSQQHIATESTQLLTPYIREEWQLKIEYAKTKNDRLRIEIQGAVQENTHKQLTYEAKLALISGF